MLRKLIMLGLILSFAVTSSLAMAEDVFITANGTKYHKEACRWVKNKETVKVDKKEALEQGFEPCRQCYKEDIVVEDEQQTKKENKNKKIAKKSQKETKKANKKSEK